METLQAERPLPPARPSRTDGLTRRLRSLLDPRHAVLLVVAVIVAYLALVPVGTMIVASLK